MYVTDKYSRQTFLVDTSALTHDDWYADVDTGVTNFDIWLSHFIAKLGSTERFYMAIFGEGTYSRLYLVQTSCYILDC